eukprot:3182775-Pleurochrysis_carterae.AAC.1
MRTLQRWGVQIPSTKQLRSALDGLMWTYVNVYGKDALAPRRQQPFLYKMLQRLCDLPEPTVINGERWSPSTNHDNFMGVTLLKVMWRSGHRLGEIVRTSDE